MEIKVEHVELAQKIAKKLHSGQFRADGKTPYIEHPTAVAHITQEHGGSIHAICLAWLHDVLEESAEKCKAVMGVDSIEEKWQWWHEVKNNYLLGSRKNKVAQLFYDLADDLAVISDHWASTQEDIKARGKLWYLSSLLLDAEEDVLLVKLADMVANIRESAGSRMSQEKRYLKAVQTLILTDRQDLTPGHRALIEEICSLVKEHSQATA